MARASLSALVHTLRWIPPGQLGALVRDRARRVLENPARFARAHRAPPEPTWRAESAPPPAPAPPQDAEALRAGRFTYLARSAELGWPPRWDAPSLSRLWRYHLHDFAFLADLDYASGRALVLDWIERHPPARGAVGWEPYPTSLRLQAWCAWLGAWQREEARADAALRARVWPSLWLQTEWLAAHLEWHLRANHLLENAVALGACGAWVEGPGEAWLARAGALLDRELPEQVLADGLHFERSPMYHARALRGLAQLAASGVPALVERVAEPLARMRGALVALVHPDGEIALLNDAALGAAPVPYALLDGALPEGCFALADAGYYGARSGAHYVVCDAAPIGPDYQPGHAHGDLLSFELSLDGQRVVVDAGVHGYDDDSLRDWCRSTRAHNTVEVEGADQCEFWSTFRVARRGRPRDVRWSPGAEGFELSAWHDGYERLPGRPRHERRFRWRNAGALELRDRVTARREVASVSRLHLHPECVLEETGERGARVRHPAGAFDVSFEGAGSLAVESSTWCPAFGCRVESLALAFVTSGRDSEWTTRVERRA